MNAAAVSAGAVLGALSRWQLSEASRKLNLTPWSTAAINCVGSFILGAAVSHQVAATTGTQRRLALSPQAQQLYLLCGTGFCGSFTTFSTFSVDTVLLLEQGFFSQALRLVVVTNVCSIGAAAVGFKAMKMIRM